MIESQWNRVIEAFGAEDGDPPRQRPDGRWSVSVSGAITSLGRLLSGSPGEFRQPAFDRVPMFDGCGQDVDDESTGGVLANADACAIVQWSDHFQAGLTATLTVYPSAEAFAEALEGALSSHREAYADAEDEGW